MATCIADGAALGELFRHLKKEDQIGSFLYAFEEIRKDRVNWTLEVDLELFYVFAMPPGEAHVKRNQQLKEKFASQQGAFTFCGDPNDFMAVHWEVRRCGLVEAIRGANAAAVSTEREGAFCT